MAKSLWDFYDGEPFMENNPRLGILALGNKPRKGKKGRKNVARRKHKGMRQPAALRKYWATHRKGRKHNAPRKRRKARRNWLNTGAMVPVNRPRRRKHHKSNPHRRRRTHRNPAIFGLYIPPIRTVAFGAIGFASPPLVQGFLTSLAPSIMQTAMSAGLVGKYAVKVTAVALTSWAVSRFISRGDGNAVAIGGAINVGLSLVNDFAPGFLPANPLSAYVPVRPGMRAYIPTRPGLRAVPQVAPRGPIQQGRGHMAAGTAANVGSSPMWGPALRYQRY